MPHIALLDCDGPATPGGDDGGIDHAAMALNLEAWLSAPGDAAAGWRWTHFSVRTKGEFTYFKGRKVILHFPVVSLHHSEGIPVEKSRKWRMTSRPPFRRAPGLRGRVRRRGHPRVARERRRRGGVGGAAGGGVAPRADV